MAASHLLLPLLCVFLTRASVSMASQQPLCLGEYQYCSEKGDCVLDASLCGTCKQGQYLCPDQKTCVGNAEAYTTCPGLKGGFFDWTLSLEERVEALAKQATLTEQIAQLTNSAPAIVRLGIPPYEWLNDDIHGVLRPLATVFPDGCGLGAMWDKDAMFNVGMAIGQEARATHNTAVHHGDRGEDPRENGVGITMYSPNMNLVRDPRWGRAPGVYTEDPVLGSHLTAKFVMGAQSGGNESSEYMQAAACCKHYAAYDLETIPVDRHHFSATVDSRNLWETYLPVFHACVHVAEVAHIMCSYNAINGVPACADSKLLNGILRDQWKWPGFVVSDYDAWAQIYDTHAYCPNMTCAAATGINAGMDQEGGGTTAIEQLQAAIDSHMTTADAVATAFKRLFRVRLQLGMHDPPTKVKWNYLQNTTIVGDVQHKELARIAAQKAMTLYQNKNATLPISTSISRIAIIGPSAVNGKLLLGNNVLEVDVPVPSILDAVQVALDNNPNDFKGNCSAPEEDVDYCSGPCPAVPSASLENCCWNCGMNDGCQYYTWLNYTCALIDSAGGKHKVKGAISARALSHYKHKVAWAGGCADVACNKTDGFQEAVTIAKGADVILMVLGLDLGQEREGHDREYIELPGHQEELFITMRNAYPHTPIVVVLVHGGTLAIGKVADADAILDAWYPGMEGGSGVADVLFGNVSPAGRAAVTSYMKTADLPAMGDTNLYPNNGSHGITYRYFTGDVLYPFGHGLSYTSFKYSHLSGDAHVKACQSISLSVTVSNVGNMDSDEVVQVYIKHRNRTHPVPNVRLAEFTRIHIPEGEFVTLKFSLKSDTRAVIPSLANTGSGPGDIYTDNRYDMKGTVGVYVGGGQPDYYRGGSWFDCDVDDTMKISDCPPQ